MASYTRDDAITRTYRNLRDLGDVESEQLLTNTEIGHYVDDAVVRFSISWPQLTTVDLVADGTKFTALPTAGNGWVDEFSAITQIELDPGEVPPAIVDPRAWGLVRTPTGDKIAWLDPPASGDTVRVTFTTTRALGALAADTTVPDHAFDALVALATSLGCLAMANHYGRTSDPVLAADTVNYRTKSEEWDRAARRWERIYTDRIRALTPPASRIVNWDVRPSFGHPFLTHPWRRR